MSIVDRLRSLLVGQSESTIRITMLARDNADRRFEHGLDVDTPPEIYGWRDPGAQAIFDREFKRRVRELRAVRAVGKGCEQ